MSVGKYEGYAVGNPVGLRVGEYVGASVGDHVGAFVGRALGLTVGDRVGTALGLTDGARVGAHVCVLQSPVCVCAFPPLWQPVGSARARVHVPPPHSAEHP